MEPVRWIALMCLAALLVGCDAAPSPTTDPDRARSSSTTRGDVAEEHVAPDSQVRNGRIVTAEPAPRPRASWCPDCDFDAPRDRVGDLALYLRSASTNRSGSTWLDGITVIGPRGPVLEISCPEDFPCLEGGSAPRAEDLAQVDWQFDGWGPVVLGPGGEEITMSSLRDRVDVRAFDGRVRQSIRLRGLAEQERVLDVAWSPDRHRLAVTTNLGRLWVFDDAGRHGRLAYTSHATSGPIYLEDLAWSPAGDTIGLLEGYEFNGSVYLVVVGAAAGKARQIYWWPSVDDDAPTYLWSPDGRRVAVDDGRRLLELAIEDGRVLDRHPRVPDPVWLARSS